MAFSRTATAPAARLRAASLRWSVCGFTRRSSAIPKLSIARAALPMFCGCGRVSVGAARPACLKRGQEFLLKLAGSA